MRRRLAAIVLVLGVAWPLGAAWALWGEMPSWVTGVFSEPPLSLLKATEIAQRKLESMKLPAGYFIRAVKLVPQVDEDKPAYYVVDFGPENGVVKVDKDGEPWKVTVQQMRVSMEGVATVVEETWPLERRPH